MITLSRLYPDGAMARTVLDELKSAGLPDHDIGIIAPSRDKSVRINGGLNRAVGVGAALGGAAGLLAGLGAFVLPGLGAVVAAGWLASALAGAAAGGAAAGVVGALIQAGLSEKDAARFAEGLKRGGSLITIRVSGQDRDFYEDILSGRMRDGHAASALPVNQS